MTDLILKESIKKHLHVVRYTTAIDGYCILLYFIEHMYTDSSIEVNFSNPGIPFEEIVSN